MSRYKFITIGSLVGLVLGFAIGTISHGGVAGFVYALSSGLKPVESVWLGTLRLIVLPLIVSYLVVAIASAVENRVAGRVGGIAVLTHALLILFLVLFTLVIALPVLSNYEVSEAARAVFQSTEIGDSLSISTGYFSMLFASLSGSVAGRVYRAILGVDIVLVLFIAVLFAIVLTRFPEKVRAPVLTAFRRVAQVSQSAVTWMLLVMPVVVFSIILSLTLSVGSEIAGTLGFWIVFVSGMLILATLLLYFVTSAVGLVPIRKFVSALGPVYAIAVASRSSYLCLPALIESAKTKLRISEHISGLVIPLSVSTFKINMVVSSPVKFIFLVHLYGDAIDPVILGSLILTTIALSLGTPGLPSGSGGFRSLPIYLAAGIPIEGYMLIAAIDAIPDVFKTIINVTEDLSVATIVSRFSPSAMPVEAVSSALSGSDLADPIRQKPLYP